MRPRARRDPGLQFTARHDMIERQLNPPETRRRDGPEPTHRCGEQARDLPGDFLPVHRDARQPARQAGVRIRPATE